MDYRSFCNLLDTKGGNVLDIISGRELFNPGCAEKFREGSTSQSLQRRVEQLINKGRTVRESHKNGRPNHSRISSTAGASEATRRLIGNRDKEFIRDDDKFFFQNAQEAWHNIKKLWK